MKKIVSSLLAVIVVSSLSAQVATLVELAARQYSTNIPAVLQDLQNGTLNLELQESIKKELINRDPQLFIGVSILEAPLVELAAKKYCVNLPTVLRDLQEGKLNTELQEIIKKELINKHPDLFILPSIKTLKGHTNWITSVAFSKCGTYALTGSFDKTVCLWDLKTGHTIKVLKGHTGVIKSVAFSPNGQYALTGSHDKTVCLWDLDTGQTIQELKGHTAWVNSVVFSPDSQYALTGSQDKTVRLWDLHYYTNASVLELQEVIAKCEQPSVVSREQEAMQNQPNTHALPNANVAEGTVPAPRDAVQELGAIQNPLLQRSITPGIIVGGVALTAAAAGGIYLMSKPLGKFYVQAREKARATWNKLKSNKVTKSGALKIAAGAAGIAGVAMLAKKLTA